MINKEDVKDLLSFSKGERNGIYILLILISILCFYGYYQKHYEQIEFSENLEFKAEVEAFLKSPKIQENHKYYASDETESKEEVQLFSFDPNSIGLSEWQQLGLSQKQAQVILNYTKKGGKFRLKSDLKKMYTISEAMYQKLEQFILLPDQLDYERKEEFESNNFNDKKDSYAREFKNKEDKEYSSVKESLISLEINICDTSDLKKLKGIGSFYARKIIEYRDELGGYYSLDQLREVWKMREETIEKVEPFLIFNASQIHKIEINHLSINELKLHPYIDYKTAKTIVNYRDQHGSFTSKDDLMKIVILDAEWINKIGPYLSYD